jgi:hypothetical protein
MSKVLIVIAISVKSRSSAQIAKETRVRERVNRETPRFNQPCIVLLYFPLSEASFFPFSVTFSLGVQSWARTTQFLAIPYKFGFNFSDQLRMPRVQLQLQLHEDRVREVSFEGGATSHNYTNTFSKRDNAESFRIRVLFFHGQVGWGSGLRDT